MKLDKSKINKILVISLTNIGDVILTFPVVDVLKRDFPSAEVSIAIGPKAQSLLKENRNFKDIFIYDKRQPLLKTLSWLLLLRKNKYDLLVDLRNSSMPLIVRARYRTSFIDCKNENEHMKEKHLNRLRMIYPGIQEGNENFCVDVLSKDQEYIKRIKKNEHFLTNPYVVVAPGAADHRKRWNAQGFSSLCDEIACKKGRTVVFTGDLKDSEVVKNITDLMKEKSVDLCGRLNLIQLAELMKGSELILTNDSAPMHLASYLDRPVLALFGPTNPIKYGPWSSNSVFIRSKEPCPACQRKSKDDEHECMNFITFDQVSTYLDGSDFLNMS